MSSFLDLSKLPAFIERFYSSNEILKTRLVGRNREHVSAYFDIARFFGPEGVKPSAVRIDYMPEPFAFTDPLIAEFSRQIETALRRQGRLYDGPSVMRLVHADFRAGSPCLTVQEARYGDQAAGFALDLPSPLFDEWGGTLRDYYKTKYPSLDSRQSPLAICFGICGLVMISEQEHMRVLFVKRSHRLASLENSIGPSVAGSIEYEPRFATLHELMISSLGKEIEEELALREDEFTIVPLAYAREIFRGDRPQLFCLIRTRLSTSELRDRVLSLEETAREFEDVIFTDITARDSVGGPEFELSSSHLLGVAPAPSSALNFEAAMNWHLVEEYLAES